MSRDIGPHDESRLQRLSNFLTNFAQDVLMAQVLDLLLTGMCPGLPDLWRLLLVAVLVELLGEQ